MIDLNTKFNNILTDDQRLTRIGKIIRNYSIDEILQFINVIKGDMKLVGARPVSVRYLQDIPEDFRDLRLKFKPGCIPPYVALNRKGDLNSVIQAEREYLFEKSKGNISCVVLYQREGYYERREIRTTFCALYEPRSWSSGLFSFLVQ